MCRVGRRQTLLQPTIAEKRYARPFPRLLVAVAVRVHAHAPALEHWRIQDWV